MTFSKDKGRGNFRGRGRGRNNFQREERRSPNLGERLRQGFKPKGRGYTQASQSYDNSNTQCDYCKKFGHIANECHKRQENVRKQNAIFLESNSNTLFITCHIAQENSSDSWFLDSGCSNHMTRNRDLFESMDTTIKSEVKLGNNDTLVVMGKGVVNVMKNHSKKTIHDVYFVPRLKHNLISIG
jgi:hypothetical protein